MPEPGRELAELMSKMPPKILNAYNIWRNTHSNTDTARILGVHRATIWKWCKQYNWERIEQLRVQQLIEEEKDTISKIREQQRLIVKIAMKSAVDQLKAGKLTARSLTDLVNLLRYQRELEGDLDMEGNNVSVNVTPSLAELHEELMKRRMEADVREAAGEPD